MVMGCLTTFLSHVKDTESKARALLALTLGLLGPLPVPHCTVGKEVIAFCFLIFFLGISYMNMMFSPISLFSRFHCFMFKVII